jgi:hypothetical protein
MAEDPYVYPGTGTLRNNLEMRDPTELSQAEVNAPVRCLRIEVPTGAARHHIGAMGRKQGP